jgi:hypothetical protein
MTSYEAGHLRHEESLPSRQGVRTALYVIERPPLILDQDGQRVEDFREGEGWDSSVGAQQRISSPGNSCLASTASFSVS